MQGEHIIGLITQLLVCSLVITVYTLFNSENQLFCKVVRLIDKMRQSVQISVKDIYNVNEALLVLKHFIDLSSRLLPFLNELQGIETPTKKEIVDKQKIISVYQSYHIDPQTSEILIGSNILQLIKESFHSIANSTSKRNYHLAQKKLERFKSEYQRLSEKWNTIGAN